MERTYDEYYKEKAACEQKADEAKVVAEKQYHDDLYSGEDHR